MTTLLVSSRFTEDNQALWRAATRRDWSVVRVQGTRCPEVHDSEIVLYVESLFAPTIAESLGLDLLNCSDAWLVNLPFHLKRRRISLTTLRQARDMTSRMFVKPPNDKSFPAAVYVSGEALPRFLDDDTAVLVAEPVRWECEYRCFCLDGRVMTCSPYLRSGVLAKETDFAATPTELADAAGFAEVVLATDGVIVPRAIVLDVGRIVDQGWAVVETNGAWGSGIYGCDPDAVLEVIRHATLRASKFC